MRPLPVLFFVFFVSISCDKGGHFSRLFGFPNKLGNREGYPSDSGFGTNAYRESWRIVSENKEMQHIWCPAILSSLEKGNSRQQTYDLLNLTMDNPPSRKIIRHWYRLFNRGARWRLAKGWKRRCPFD